MTRQPPIPDLDEVRFFVDEDLAGVGLGLMQLRNDVVTGSHEPVLFIPRRDEQWIPEVAKRGWVVITADRHIRTRHYEATAAIEHALLCVCLRPAGSSALRWDYVRLLAAHWEAVESMCGGEGPDWLEVKTQRTRHLDYQPGRPPRLPSIEA